MSATGSPTESATQRAIEGATQSATASQPAGGAAQLAADARRRTPSVQMLRPHLEDLPPLEDALRALPAGYAFRTYRPGDEAGWAALMNTGEMSHWDADVTREKLTGRPWPQFDPQGLFVITHSVPGAEGTRGARGGGNAGDVEGQIVGSACAWLIDPEDRETGTLHMVCVLPEHRGARLGYPLCLAVLHRFRERGYRRVQLNTGDWRLGAVKTYLRLGFQPWYRKPTHPEQWRHALVTLGWTEPVEPVLEPGYDQAPADSGSSGPSTSSGRTA